ncbi:MAG TPA: hypothetical protein VLI67_12200, partial [Vicinamibacteria bacterium]|nr:hypothetical protein [Vicinamibacteria bacterium]
ASALALAEQGGSDVLVDLADLLADPEAPARVAAAHAVSVHGRDAGVPLLRLKALAGDPEPRVVTECLLALLRLDPERSLPFVAAFLERSEGAAAAAAALGESRLEKALPVLAAWLDRASRPGSRRAALLAIAALRRDEAVDLLLSVVREGPAPAARDALDALATIGGGGALLDRAKAAVGSRRDLGDALVRAFGHGTSPRRPPYD